MSENLAKDLAIQTKQEENVLTSFQEYVLLALKKKDALLQQRHIGNDVKSMLADFTQIAEMAIKLSKRQEISADLLYLKKKNLGLNITLTNLSVSTLNEMKMLVEAIAISEDMSDSKSAFRTLVGYVKNCVSKVGSELKKVG